MRAVTERLAGLENVEVWEQTFTIDLLTLDGACRGAIVWNQRARQDARLGQADDPRHRRRGATLPRNDQPAPWPPATGWRWPTAPGPSSATWSSCSSIPRCSTSPAASRSLISEATRGEGAHLVDRHGHRFMPDYDPRAELAPRDVVSLSIVSQMEKTRHPNVYLDMTHLDPQRVMSRFPGIAAICAEFDLDITRDRIPVRPGAHYMMGGVDGRRSTAARRCRACGRPARSAPRGLHGANRLASNSLLEALVYGAHAGEGASLAAAETERRLLRPADRESRGSIRSASR